MRCLCAHASNMLMKLTCAAFKVTNKQPSRHNSGLTWANANEIASEAVAAVGPPVAKAKARLDAVASQ